MTEQERAFQWIVDLVRAADIPFQVVGGLAARAYGATRPLVDIDLFVPMSRLEEAADRASEHVEWGPARVRGGGWDIVFVKMRFAGQQVELGGDEDVSIYDRRANQWVALEVDVESSVPHAVLGRVVPVMPRHQLIHYKWRLDRPVDRSDLRGMASDAGRATPTFSPSSV